MLRRNPYPQASLGRELARWLGGRSWVPRAAVWGNAWAWQVDRVATPDLGCRDRGSVVACCQPPNAFCLVAVPADSLPKAGVAGQIVLVHQCSRRAAQHTGATTVTGSMADLHTAARNGDKDRIVELVTKGADVTVRDKLSRTPLHLAAWAGHLVRAGSGRTCRACTAWGAMHARDSRDEERCPHISTQRQRPGPPHGTQDVAKLLMAHGCSPTYAAMDDMNALHFAAQKGHTEICRTLITAGGGRAWPRMCRPTRGEGRNGIGSPAARAGRHLPAHDPPARPTLHTPAQGLPSTAAAARG